MEPPGNRSIVRRPAVESGYEIRVRGALPPDALRDLEAHGMSVQTVLAGRFGPVTLRRRFERLQAYGAELREVRRRQDED